MEWILVYVPPVNLSRPDLTFPFSKDVLFFINSSRPKRRSLLIFEIQFPILFIFTFVQHNQGWKVVTKNKMDNPRFIDEEDIPLVQDEDYDITRHWIQAG